YVLSVGVANARGQDLIRGAELSARMHDEFWTGQEGKLFQHVSHRLLVNEEATKDAILTALDEAYDRIQPGDTVVVNLAGHGGPVDLFGPWGFVAYDRQISATYLQEKVQRLASKAGTVLVILESCHSGAFTVVAPNVVVLAAASAEEYSYQLTDGASVYC